MGWAAGQLHIAQIRFFSLRNNALKTYSRMASQLNDTDNGPLGLLLSRRSGSAKRMTGPGPTAAELDVIFATATRVPDHGKLAPWRFIVFEDHARARFGEILAACAQAANPDADDERLRVERERFLR